MNLTVVGAALKMVTMMMTNRDNGYDIDNSSDFGEVRRTEFIVLIVIEFFSSTIEVQVERNTGRS